MGRDIWADEESHLFVEDGDGEYFTVLGVHLSHEFKRALKREGDR